MTAATVGAVTLRPATAADAERILAWRNDPWIVSLSAHRKTVGPEEHRRWFENVLASDRHLLCVVVAPDGGDVGVLRLDLDDDAHAWVTVYLLREHTGRGYGVDALRRAAVAAAARWPRLETLHAVVRADNRPSLKAFARAGFAPCAAGRRRSAEEGTVELVLTLAEEAR